MVNGYEKIHYKEWYATGKKKLSSPSFRPYFVFLQLFILIQNDINIIAISHPSIPTNSFTNLFSPSKYFQSLLSRLAANYFNNTNNNKTQKLKDKNQSTRKLLNNSTLNLFPSHVSNNPHDF
jgi:hypothetical protein